MLAHEREREKEIERRTASEGKKSEALASSSSAAR